MANDNSTTNSGIYIIRNLKNGKFYIGQAVNFRSRWQEHRRKLRLNEHHNSHLQAAWNKYGENFFKFMVLEYCSVDKLDEREQVQLDSHALKDNCYNISLDATAPMRGRKISDEQRAERSIRMRGENHPMFGKPGVMRGKHHSEETRRRMSEAQSNRSPETRHRISEAKLGHVVSEETRKKISDHKRGQKHTEEVKRRISEGGRKRAPISEETRLRMSEAQRNPSDEKRAKMRERMKGNPSPMQGKVMSEAHKRKIGEANKLRHAERRAQKERAEQGETL